MTKFFLAKVTEERSGIESEFHCIVKSIDEESASTHLQNSVLPNWRGNSAPYDEGEECFDFGDNIYGYGWIEKEIDPNDAVVLIRLGVCKVL